MKDNTSDAININILDKEYLISCSEEERNALLSAARLLDKNMREIRASGKVIGSERIAVMAGLNIAHDLLTKNSNTVTKSSSDEDAVSRINAMQEKIDQVLNNQHELEL